MTLLECIKEKGLSRYSLSKISGVPWDVLSELCYGEIRFEQCSKELLSKLSEVLWDQCGRTGASGDRK